MKTIRIMLLLLASGYASRAQTVLPGDTSLVFSITIFNKKDGLLTRFPDVNPDIQLLKLISGLDTVACTYEFPFLVLGKEDYTKLKNRDIVRLAFRYYHVGNRANACYALIVPLRFRLSYKPAKFLVIEQYEKRKFVDTQRWGSTMYTGKQLNTEVVYE